MLHILLIGFAVFVALVVMTELESFGLATIVFLGSVFAVQKFHIFDLLTYVQENTYQSAMIALAFLACGVVWSFIKWFSYLMKQRDKYREQLEDIQARRSEYRTEEDFQSVVQGLQRRFKRPKASEHKSQITAWMAFWPFSLVGTFLNDPIRRLFNFLFSRFKDLYQQMADRVFKDHPELK